MNVTNMLEPDLQNLPVMPEIAVDEPIFLVNLLKFNDYAQYPDKRDAELSGKDAYARYLAVIYELLPQYGGEIVFCGDVTGMWLGQVDELWDEVLVVKYPSRTQMIAMGSCDRWQEGSIHRSAGLKGQLNIETIAPPHC